MHGGIEAGVVLLKMLVRNPIIQNEANEADEVIKVVPAARFTAFVVELGSETCIIFPTQIPTTTSITMVGDAVVLNDERGSCMNH